MLNCRQDESQYVDAAITVDAAYHLSDEFAGEMKNVKGLHAKDED